MTAAEQYARGLAAWRANRAWQRRDAQRRFWDADKRRGVDRSEALTYFERRQLRTRRPFGARPR